MSKILPIRGCAFCLKEFRPKRTWQQFCGNACRRSATKEQLLTEYTCAYCGMVADTIDHVPPTSIRPTLVLLGLSARYPFTLVRCCKECSVALGDKAFWTVEQRREYIAKWLERRYRKYLAIPDWTAKDLNELEHDLREMTIHGLAVKALTIERLKIARQEDSLNTSLTTLQEVDVIKLPKQLCRICKNPTTNELYCSSACSFCVTWIPKLGTNRRRIMWRAFRRILKKTTKEQHRYFKVKRLQFKAR